jgi:site-specific recombinase XerC
VFERYLTPAEERQLLRTLAQYADVLARRDHAWMRWMRHTGIRVAAASRFTCGDAREALAAGEQVVRGEKGGRTTRIPLRKGGRRALQDLLRLRREMGQIEDPEAPLVVSRRGAALSVRSYQARMREWCKAAGLSAEASPHWLRHTLAKRVMANSTARDPRGVVMALLNHSSITSTSVYTMPDREEIERALDEASC